MTYTKLFLTIIFAFFLIIQPAVGQSAWKAMRPATSGDLVAVYFTGAQTGWVAGDNGYLASTSDGGTTWNKFALNTTDDINEIYFRNDKNGYLVAGRKMFITDNGGNTWRETRIFRSSAFKNATPEFLSIRFADKKKGLAIGSLLSVKGNVIDSVVMRTDDGGDTWSRIEVPAKVELFHLDFNGSSRGWIVGDKGLILAT
ncbi:MAG TPA: YCF48-related protein, partial [Pyrinomonadaceae bacterium]|nr:YCF48-related protein [Pyrinomonadaceae bacterium]